jgi:hypothetical protein
MKFSSHLTENIFSIHYKRQSIKRSEFIGISCEHYAKYMNTPCGYNEGIYSVTVSVTVSVLTAGCKLWLWLEAPWFQSVGSDCRTCVWQTARRQIFPSDSAIVYLSVSHSIAFVSHGQWDKPQAYTVSPSSAGALNLIQNICFSLKVLEVDQLFRHLSCLCVYLFSHWSKHCECECECEYRHHSCHEENQQPFKMKINLNSI